MDERVMQFRVGAFVLGTLLFAGILLFMFGKLPKFIGYYAVQARFDDAGGVTKGAPVRINGVAIGRVRDIRLADNDQSVLLTMEIHSDITLYRNETPYIIRDFMGNTAVVFVPSKVKGGKRVAVAPGTVLEGKYSDDPTGMKRELQRPINTVTETGMALTAASKKLEAAADRVNAILNPEAQQNVQDILQGAAKSLRVINEVLGDKENQKKLAKSLGNLPQTIDSMNDAFVTADRALRKFTESPPGSNEPPPIDRLISMIDRMERTLRKFTESSDPNQPPPVDQIAKALGNIDEITELMRSIMARIDRGEGSLGALLKDRQLYDRLNRAARNIEQVSRELRPIVDDAGVFMDKAARHPGVIIRDAVKPGIGIK